MIDSFSDWIPADNETLRIFFSRIYNGWFCRWRDQTATMTDEEWHQVLDEGNAILEDIGESSTAKAITSALLHELAARRRECFRSGISGKSDSAA